MEMEVMTIQSPTEFNFDSACTSPYISAPSSPQRFGNFFYSAPTSPTRISAFYNDFQAAGDSTLSATRVSLSNVPFEWEETPGTPKIKEAHISTATSSNYGDADEEELEDIDFAFDFSGHLDRAPLTADELFDGGKIKPLKPPPRLEYDQRKSLDSPKSPRSPKKMIREALSPRHRKKDNFDPFAAALEQTRRESSVRENANEKRGRERTINSSGSRSKNARSLSPFRVSDLLYESDPSQEPTKTSNTSLFSSISFASFWYNKKWKIKDLLLFRSASESRATDKEQLKKYAQLKKTRHHDDVKNSSFRSTDSVGSASSRRRSGAPVSAHELHYTVNRAVSEEMKKRTSLPYKQGLLGCLGFHPTLSEFSKGLSPNGSMSRG